MLFAPADRWENALIVASILGLIVGVILALTGAGGGILAVPLLVFGAGLGVAEAGPIGLLAVGMAAALGAALGLKAGVVRYKASMLIAGTGMLASPLGVWLAHSMDHRWLTGIFGIVLLLVAFKTFVQARDRRVGDDSAAAKAPPCVRSPATARFIWTMPCARALGLSGAFTGALSGLLGVGGGFVMVPALTRFTDLEMKSVVATSLAVIAFISVAGVAASALAGKVEWVVALPFSAGALAGMAGGRLIAARLAGAHLQKSFALVAGGVAIMMLAKALV